MRPAWPNVGIKKNLSMSVIFKKIDELLLCVRYKVHKTLVMEQIHKIWLGFGFSKCDGEIDLRQVEKGYSSFLPGIFDNLFLKDMTKALRNFGKSSNMTKIWQKMKKSFPFSSCLKLIFWLISGIRKCNFGYLFHY